MLSHAAVLCSGGSTKGSAAGRPEIVVSLAKDPVQNQREQVKAVWPEHMEISWSTLTGRVDKDANEAARQSRGGSHSAPREAARQSGTAARAEPVGRAAPSPQSSRDPRQPPLGSASTAFPGFRQASRVLVPANVCLEAATAAPTSIGLALFLCRASWLIRRACKRTCRAIHMMLAFASFQGHCV